MFTHLVFVVTLWNRTTMNNENLLCMCVYIYRSIHIHVCKHTYIVNVFTHAYMTV